MGSRYEHESYPQRSSVESTQGWRNYKAEIVISAAALATFLYLTDNTPDLSRFAPQDEKQLSRTDLDSSLALDTAGMVALRDSVDRNEVFTTSINGTTYAWPVGRPRRSFYLISLPCDINATTDPLCHGDTTRNEGTADAYATDFVYRDAGTGTGNDSMYLEPVRAITDGTIIEVEQDARRDADCSTLRLDSVDGHQYYYGHLSNNQMVVAGQQVTAGQQIAEVGNDTCGQGVAHLHLEEAVAGLPAGPWQNRDPKLIGTMTQLLSELPD